MPSNGAEKVVLLLMLILLNDPLREVMVTRLISTGTVEEAMLELAKKKLELEKNVTSGNAADGWE